jgi:hypothetical protein
VPTAKIPITPGEPAGRVMLEILFAESTATVTANR